MLPSRIFSVVPHHIKFLLHCGELLRRLKVQVRAALPLASLSCPCRFRGPLSPQCHAGVPCSSRASLADPKAALLTSLHLGAFQPAQWELVNDRISEAYMIQVISSYHGAVCRML